MLHGRQSGLSLALGTIIVLGSLGAVLYFSYVTQAPTRDFVLHWRITLQISNFSQPLGSDYVPIPGNIGVPGGLWANHTLDRYGGTFAPLHTDNQNGIIQIELKSRPAKPFTLGDFFNIWGVPLNTTCVWTYCSPHQGPPPFMTTSLSGYTDSCIQRGYPLFDGDRILMLIGGNSSSPSSLAPPCG